MKRFFALILCLTLAGCGGGTTGTSGTGGGGDFEVRSIQGNFIQEQGAPLNNAIVSVDGGTESTTTDQNGHYELSADVADSFTLLVQSEGSEVAVPVSGVESGVKSVTVDAQIDRTTGSASVQSLSGYVEVIYDCAVYAKGSGSASVNLTVPDRVLNCDLRFVFSGSGVSLGQGSVRLKNSNCSGVSSNTHGNQTNGSRVFILQGLRIPRQNRSCSAEFEANFPGLISSPVFPLRIIPGGDGALPDVNVVYSGSLRNRGPAQDLASCARFNDNRIPVTFSIRNGTVNLSLPSEQLQFSAPVNKQAVNDSQRYSVHVTGSSGLSGGEAIDAFASRGVGESQAEFVVFYSNGGPNSTCQRSYFGMLSKTR